MINVGSFQGTSMPNVSPHVSTAQGFQKSMETTSSVTVSPGGEEAWGTKVDLSYMFDKLEKHGFINADERAYLTQKVTDRSQIYKAVSDLKGPGLAANAAYKMQEGVLLPNGVLTLTNDRRTVQRLAQLTRYEVQTIEAAQGSDMGIGQIGMLATTVALSKEKGIISGELGLKDFNMLKNWFKENGKPGSREFIETQEMLSKLYDLLASKDKH